MAVPAAFLAPVLLLCGLGPRLAAAHGPTGVECVLFNEEYMTCVWGSRETLTTNYSLYYWYENRSPVVECKRYLWDRGVSIGCHFNQSEIVQFQPFHVLLNASLNGQALEIRSKRMELQDLVKPGAPVNLTIRNMSSNQLQLTWSSPYPKAQCLEHAVKYKSNKDTSWIEHGVKGDIFSFPSVDYEKYYTFYVRSKINSYCGSTQLWSEWSVPVVWGRNTTSKGLAEEQLQWFWIHTVLVPIASCLLLLVLVVLLAPRVSSCNKALLRFGLGRSRSGVLGGGELGFTSTPAPPLRPHKRRGAGCSPAVPSRSSMFICISHGDNQSFLVNTDCPVLLLLSHLRSKVGVPATDVIDLCDKLGTPKLLFQVKTLRERASEFLPAPGTYYVCRVDLGTPGTAQEQASRTFTPLLKDPSAALTEALRQHGQHPHRRLQRSLKAAEGRRTPTTEALPAGTQAQGAGKAAARGAARPGEEQEGAPRRAPKPPGGRQRQPRQR